MVSRFTTAVTVEAKVVAMGLTAAGTHEYGTGRMAKAYSVKYGRNTRSRCTMRLTNSRPYAKYVFQGTQTPIMARGKAMPVGKSQLGLGRGTRAPKAAKFTYRRAVRGQTGNNYPMRAIRVVFARRRM